MLSTMQEGELSVARLLRYGSTVHGDRTVKTWGGSQSRIATYCALGKRAAQLAHALGALGVTGDERVATFMWNNNEHLEAYLAVPGMGAVLHTLNIRLSPEQLAYIANHAADRVVIVDGHLVPQFSQVLPLLETVRHVVVANGDAATLEAPPGVEVHSFDLAAFYATVHDRRRAVGPAGLGPDHRADVPRYGLGPSLRRDDGRCISGHAGPLSAARIDRGDSRRGKADLRGGGADDLARSSPATGDHTAGHIAPERGRSRRGGVPAIADADLFRAIWSAAPAHLGHDRNVPARFCGPPWQLPENWSFIDEIPKTSVGKFDKKRLRALYHEHGLEVSRVDRRSS